jgi:hypothetical protein
MLTPDTLAFPAEPLEHECTPAERAKGRRYQLEVLVSAAVYTATIFVSAGAIDRLVGVPKIAVALLPMLGVAGMILAFIRYVRRVDEFQRQMFVVAGAIAGLGTAVITMAFGFLENAGVPRISMVWVWPITCVIFAVCAPIVRRRYR